MHIYIYIFIYTYISFLPGHSIKQWNNSSHPSRSLPSFFNGLDLQYFSVEVMEPAWWGTSRASQVSTGEHVSLGCDRRTSCMGWIHPWNLTAGTQKSPNLKRKNHLNQPPWLLIGSSRFFPGCSWQRYVEKKRCSRESCRYWRCGHFLHLVMVWRRFWFMYM